MPTDQTLVDERNHKILTLGNLTIITQALNTSIRDADWNTKKIGHGTGKAGLEKYAEGIDIFSSFLARTIWDEKAIEDRAAFLYEKAVAVWSI